MDSVYIIKNVQLLNEVMVKVNHDKSELIFRYNYIIFLKIVKNKLNNYVLDF